MPRACLTACGNPYMQRICGPCMDDSTAAQARGQDGGRPGPAQGGDAQGPAAAAPARSLTWAEAETMDILADDDMMEGIAEGREDAKAGRLVEWKPQGAGHARPA